MKYLLSSMNKTKKSDQKVEKLLDKKMFIFIPMANPDGVARGFSTIDMSQNDPEEEFNSSNNQNSPEMFKIREFLINLSQLDLLETVIILKSDLGRRTLKLSTTNKDDWISNLRNRLVVKLDQLDFEENKKIGILTEINKLLPKVRTLGFNLPTLSPTDSNDYEEKLVSHVETDDDSFETVVKSSKNGVTLSRIKMISRAIIDGLNHSNDL